MPSCRWNRDDFAVNMVEQFALELGLCLLANHDLEISNRKYAVRERALKQKNSPPPFGGRRTRGIRSHAIHRLALKTQSPLRGWSQMCHRIPTTLDQSYLWDHSRCLVTPL